MQFCEVKEGGLTCCIKFTPTGTIKKDFMEEATFEIGLKGPERLVTGSGRRDQSGRKIMPGAPGEAESLASSLGLCVASSVERAD